MKCAPYRIVLEIFFLTTLFISSQVFAHESSKGISALRIDLSTNQASAKWAISYFDMEILTRFDQDKNDLISSEEMAGALQTVKSLAEQGLEFYFSDQRVKPDEVKADLQEGKFEVIFSFKHVPTDQVKYRSALIRRLPPDHQELATIFAENEQQLLFRTLTAKDNEFEIQRTDGKIVASAEAPGAAQVTFFAMLKQGVWHILIGFDHLLFLFALLVMCESFRSVVKIVTCFTVAHSVTLALAAFDVFQIPGKIVEPLIAVTIIYVGIENLFRWKTIRLRWLLTFIFGLIHGFGFAGALRELGLGSSNILLPVISFNLGVELGQITVAAVVLPLLWRVSKIPKVEPRWIPACSIVVIALGGYWFIDRVF